MFALTLRRLSGLAAVVAGPLCIIGGLLHPIDDGHAHSADALASSHLAGSVSLLLGTVLLLLGLPGVYGWLAPRIGTLGLVGYVLYFLGNVLSAIPHLVVMSFAGEYLAEHDPEIVSENDLILGAPGFEVEQIVSGIGLVLGLLVLGIALLRARGIPRWLGWAGVVGAVLMLVPIPVTPVLSGLQVELLRGALITGLGLLAIDSARQKAVTAEEPVGAARP